MLDCVNDMTVSDHLKEMAKHDADYSIFHGEIRLQSGETIPLIFVVATGSSALGLARRIKGMEDGNIVADYGNRGTIKKH